MGILEDAQQVCIAEGLLIQELEHVAEPQQRKKHKVDLTPHFPRFRGRDTGYIALWYLIMTLMISCSFAIRRQEAFVLSGSHFKIDKWMEMDEKPVKGEENSENKTGKKKKKK